MGSEGMESSQCLFASELRCWGPSDCAGHASDWRAERVAGTSRCELECSVVDRARQELGPRKSRCTDVAHRAQGMAGAGEGLARRQVAGGEAWSAWARRELA